MSDNSNNLTVFDLSVLEEGTNNLAPPARSIKMPGKTTYAKSENDTLRLSILNLAVASDAFNPGTGQKTRVWNELYGAASLGYLDVNGGYVDGPLVAHVLWTCVNPGTAKLSPLVKHGLEYDAKMYTDAIANGREPTELQKLSFKVKSQQDVAEAKAKAAKVAAAAAKSKDTADKVRMETGLNLTGNSNSNQQDRGVSLPPNTVRAVQQLGAPTGSGGANANAVSQSAREAAVAAAAAGGAMTINYGPGEKPRTPRNIDSINAIDEFAMSAKEEAASMTKCFDRVANILTSSASASIESPATKKQRRYKDISENIKRILEEIKALKEMGMPTEREEEEYVHLRHLRSGITAAQESATNLGPAFNNES